MRQMIWLALLAAAPAFAQSTLSQPARPSEAARSRYDICLSQAKADPVMAIETAQAWRIEGGGVPARHCLALAQLARGDTAVAIESFKGAALASEAANDGQAAAIWAQAGNAALLAGQNQTAADYLSTAIAEAAGRAKADPLIDRARAYVELKKLPEAAADLDRATAAAPNNNLGWLLRATLARRMGDLKLAETAILEAAKRAPGDADVQFEAGNIAAAQGNDKLAREAWMAAARAAPASPAGKAAQEALTGD